MSADRQCTRAVLVALLLVPLVLLGVLLAIHYFTLLPRDNHATVIVEGAPEPRRSPEELKELLLSALEPGSPPAWGDFLRCVVFFQTGGDREEAARRFREFVSQYPNARYISHYSTVESYTTEARELADLLEQMAREDRAWVEPEDPSRLSLDERIRYDIYHLRDVQVWQWEGPGSCNLLWPYAGTQPWSVEPAAHNAAMDLRDIGAPAIPALLEILDDRRPLRSVAFYRFGWQSRMILRYQDAAHQILAKRLPAEAFYHACRTRDYLSEEPPEIRQTFIEHVREWYDANK